jgi:branched-subunit amino acid aminotransferase/4-amino-4-deoxychorismate lyase
MDLCREHDIPLEERNVSLTEVHTADECFTTGTMGELSPVIEVDGRSIGDGKVGPVTRRLQDIYSAKTALEGEKLPF